MAIQTPHKLRVLPRLDSASDLLDGVTPELIAAGELRVGMTAGRYSVIDALRLFPKITGGWNMCTVMSWRMSRVDVKELFDEVNLGHFGEARLVVAHEMRGIERHEFEAISELAGDRLRVCRSHLKGFFLSGDAGHVAYLTSANFNRNPRNESFELHLGGPVASAYASMSDMMFEFQKPRAWLRDKAAGSKLYKHLFVQLRLDTPMTMGESRTDKARRLADTASVDTDDLDDLEDLVTLPKLLAAMREVSRSKFGDNIREALVPSFRELNENRDVFHRKIRHPDAQPPRVEKK